MSVEGLIREPKYPTSKKRYVGIEIEFLISNTDEEKLRKLLIKYDLQWYVNLGEDGSIRDEEHVPILAIRQVRDWGNNGYRSEQYESNRHLRKSGAEIRILAQEDEAPEIVTKTCEAIQICGGIINKTCGLHVHVDMRSRDYKLVYNNLYYVQDLMFACQPKERRNNEYCRKLVKMFKSNNEERYYAINKKAYNEHRTIEIRLHEGTIDSKSILMWVGFLIKIADIKEPLTKKIKTVDQLPWLPDALKGYLNARIAKYA